jgi:leucyl aminopeptidase (aminopeptidase T)
MAMELASLSAAAILTLVFSETFKEVGKTLGKETLETGGKLVKLLWEKRPGAAKALQAGESAPEYKTAIVEVEQLAQTDPEIQAMIAEIMQALQAQPQGQQIVNSFVQKAANVYNAPVTIEKQEINF